MSSLTYTRQARQDLLTLWEYIAEDNISAADRLLDSIGDKCKLLAATPRLGRARSGIEAGLRHFPVGNYLILYRELPGGVQIVRVIHGARNLYALLLTDD